ncbi:MAG: poly(ADP-ribose) glycohydrolase [Desertifilum sp.]|nr:poly(ADP-ribose) glycohydrolase [Desertifilum sp.]
MSELLDNLICRHAFNTQELVETYPPNLYDSNKQVVYDIACPPGSVHRGTLCFSRWRGMKLPEGLPASGETVLKEYSGYFEYEPSPDSQEMEWYLNFADLDLFYAYGSPLFAQDEMQVAEHPALASLREALLANEINLFTAEKGGPTPVLVRGVERRCAIATNPNASQQRPFGLYGNNFARATTEAIALATKPLNPPTVTNILAISAPSCRSGSYTQKQIEHILTTAFTGFTAARLDSEDLNIAIHTGFWGCGAFGGNRVLMALLQLLAAHLAQINRLIFHTSDRSGSEAFATAQNLFYNAIAPNSTVSELITQIHAMDFQWGVSDGN